ncbi:hypothetical protein BZL30_8596 [Mycobacterium kansasii]|uniref:Uncharacterized protein n=1 Tax=Mycobacterium kansasii TaxID=1768 RepID=A0A1V3WFE0_MYCKA|nr:hypothetical protein BZL30_8596 [Mycobacterium kansasii]
MIIGEPPDGRRVANSPRCRWSPSCEHRGYRTGFTRRCRRVVSSDRVVGAVV